MSRRTNSYLSYLLCNYFYKGNAEVTRYHLAGQLVKNKLRWLDGEDCLVSYKSNDGIEVVRATNLIEIIMMSVLYRIKLLWRIRG